MYSLDLPLRFEAQNCGKFVFSNSVKKLTLVWVSLKQIWKLKRWPWIPPPSPLNYTPTWTTPASHSNIYQTTTTIPAKASFLELRVLGMITIQSRLVSRAEEGNGIHQQRVIWFAIWNICQFGYNSPIIIYETCHFHNFSNQKIMKILILTKIPK